MRIEKWLKRLLLVKDYDLNVLVSIAKYFDVSTDFLLGNSHMTNHGKDPESVSTAISHIVSYAGKAVSEHDRETIVRLIDVYLSSRED